MSKTPNYGAKIKDILDALMPGERIDRLTGEKWVMTDEEIDWYKKFNVPPPTVSLPTRWKQHGSWFVGYQFWYQKHPETGKPIVGTIHPATGLKMLPDTEWFTKDFTEKGIEYDPSAPFFAQFRALQVTVPAPAGRNHIEPKNSIAVVSQGDEDSYFVCACRSKRTYYAHVALDVEDSAEVFSGNNIQNSFNVVHSSRIHNCQFIRESRDCMNSAFLFDCRNCEFCFGATNKRNKKYLWWNEQLSKEEWEKRKAEVDLGSRRVMDEQRQKFYELIRNQGIWPENFNENITDSTGEYLTKTTNVHESYLCEGGTNFYGCNFSYGDARDNAFVGYPVWSTNCYYACSAGRSNLVKFSHLSVQCNDVEYCSFCYNCENCFGCVGLNRKKFCIFNKQYSEEEYWKRLDELKCAMLDRGEYGEFFPTQFSPSYYRDASCIHWFGGTDEEMIKIGVNDFDPESMEAIGQDLMDASKLHNVSELPDHIKDLGPEWINAPMFDAVTKRRYAIVAPEVELYKRQNIAPPVKHAVGRMRDLWTQANMGSFTDANCAKCGKSVRVAKNTGHPERRIYCQADYLQYLETNG